MVIQIATYATEKCTFNADHIQSQTNRSKSDDKYIKHIYMCYRQDVPHNIDTYNESNIMGIPYEGSKLLGVHCMKI